MNTKELIEALGQLKVQTGSLVCLGCGHEHMLREGLFDLQKEAPDFIKTKSEEFLSRMMEGK